MTDEQLPKGQRWLTEFPRFGQTQFADRRPAEGLPVTLAIDIEGQASRTLDSTDLEALPRETLTADFHCVTTWSYPALSWEGVSFADLFEAHVEPALGEAGAEFVIFRGLDGFRCYLPLAQALASEILLADTLSERPLTSDHGAPLRVVVPSCYGYKQAKHLSGLSFVRSLAGYRPAGLDFMEHPTARVALEERGKGLPGPVLRYLYRPVVRSTIRRFQR